MEYEKFLEQNKEEMIASLQSLLQCQSEQGEPVKTPENFASKKFFEKILFFCL